MTVPYSESFVSLGNAPRFLVLRRRYVGDIVLVTPLLRAIRTRYPQAQIDIVIDSPYKELLRHQQEINRQLILPYRRGWHTLPEGMRLFCQILRSRYDVVLDLSRNDRSQLLCKIARSKHKLTWEIAGQTLKNRSIYTRLVSFPAGSDLQLPVQQFFQSLLLPFDITPDNAPARIYATEEEKAWASAWLKSQGIHGKPFFIHSGTRSEARRWPVENFATIAKNMVEQNIPVILMGGPGDEVFTDRIKEQAGSQILAAPTNFSLRQVLALFHVGRGLLAHDSGPMHLAIASQLPVIALFGSQPIHVWAPDNARALYLQSPQPCQNCLYPDKCVLSDSYRTYCVQKLDTSYVWSQIQSFLAPISG